jgi:acetyltransferase-like isoleucine patch superfamily enzyme/glycosyltransferase involved in cell wall biosynthesis
VVKKLTTRLRYRYAAARKQLLEPAIHLAQQANIYAHQLDQKVTELARHLEQNSADLRSEDKLSHVTIMAAARSVALRGDHRQIMPFDPPLGRKAPLSIGLFGNQANQSYITAKSLRRLGYNVDLIIQPDLIDKFAMAHPAWEDESFESDDLNDISEQTQSWVRPDYVRAINYDMNLQLQYQNRLSAAAEVADLYKTAFNVSIATDTALLLAQHMGYWPYLKAMFDYDVVNLSMAAVFLGCFCPRPYTVMPLGGELYISAFEETVFGLLFRASFRGAAHTLVAETDYGVYLDRLEAKSARTFAPLIVDTDIYTSGQDDQLRSEWQRTCGGKRFLLTVCRQSWEWKGNDRLIRAFARFSQARGFDWRLVLIAWGDSVQKSKDLIQSLSIADKVVWLQASSKALLRRRQRAADVICDQFVMEGYGSSVLESMAAGKPIIIRPVPRHSLGKFAGDPPPFLNATTEDEIHLVLNQLLDDGHIAAAGRASRDWLERWHGHAVRGPKFVWAHEVAAGRVVAEHDGGQESDKSTHLLLVDLQKMHRELRTRIQTEWNRSVPFGDQITDRWERAKFLGFGEGASVYDSTLVLGQVAVGLQTWIGPHCILDGSGGLTIGSTCSISASCQLYSHDTVGWAVSGGKAPFRHSKTTIGDGVYLGPGTVVAAGVAIGNNSIIGALSLVNHDIPPFSFAAGAPARVIGQVRVSDDGSYMIEALGSRPNVDTE